VGVTVRVGFDMDGVFADFAKAYREMDASLFGGSTSIETSVPDQSDRPGVAAPSGRQHRTHGSRNDAVWAAIRATPDFWVGLEPIEEGAVRRLHALMLDRRWEIFFITQRPPTCGDTVQRQTQRWLREQGFEMPSVLPVSSGRVAAVTALSLHHYVDDDAKNCVDCKSDGGARPILIVDDDDAVATSSARRLGITTAPGIGAALDILETVSVTSSRPRLLRQVVEAVGWR
jgi:5' nucleotidase, deoxy (Pyrimidine), cytosolic type C protein (NT5C)